jgi:hypothetical protein
MTVVLIAVVVVLWLAFLALFLGVAHAAALGDEQLKRAQEAEEQRRADMDERMFGMMTGA